jgi:enediyne biosynthesis protein E7
MTRGIRAFDIAAFFFPFIRKLPFPRMVEIAEARRAVSRCAAKIMQGKQAETSVGKDILSVMIEQNEKSEGLMSETDVVDQIMTLLLAGHETTSTAVNPSARFCNE